MYPILIKLMLISALLQLGISVSKLTNCSNGSCYFEYKKAANAVLQIEWKPISVFPEEAKRLQEYSNWGSRTVELSSKINLIFYT